MRSYRNLISVLASPKLLSTTGLPQWLSSHPAAQVGKEGRTTQVTPDKAIEKHQDLVKNLADIYTFLSPILPTVEETTCKIKCYREDPAEETDQEQQLQEELEEDQEQKEQTQGMEANEQQEEGNSDDSPKKGVHWNFTNLSEEEQDREQRRLEEDTTEEILGAGGIG